MYDLAVHMEGVDEAPIIKCYEYFGGGILKYKARDQAVARGREIYESKPNVVKVAIFKEGVAQSTANVPEEI